MEQSALRQVSKRINASDVVSLLREVYPEGVQRRNEAEALIAFDREFSDPAPEWRGFMAAAVADHLLARSEPLGIVTDEKAVWLIRSLAPASRELTDAGAEALLRTIELARDVSPVLIAFAIREFWRSVLLGDGRAHAEPVLNASDVALLRRLLEAGAGAGERPISVDEAEALFDLHDAIAASGSDAAFDDVFFRSITNFLLDASGCETPGRIQALSREPRRDAGEGIAAELCAWLSMHIMRDGRPTPAERALLALIDRSPEPDPSLKRWFYRAA